MKITKIVAPEPEVLQMVPEPGALWITRAILPTRVVKRRNLGGNGCSKHGVEHAAWSPLKATNGHQLHFSP